ncbi:type II toxin-antitoxin system PemK/MazF family toxin [Thermococcus sp. M39]|uniref:type II toxin-antitoxin system PemK/MazF family toxin n=1 Tax=Thermococcus sp. M39 TaxID=1638262 RepID=UPI001F10CD1A|nr:type II toxin-antitoxin system PemK/MazF family toxin [Thermococcus sp. M39]
MEALIMNQIRPKPHGDLKQWEIIMVEFPFIDLVQKKLRPALIISNDALNKISNSVIVVQITSNLFSGFKEYNVFLSDSDVIRYKGTLPMYQSIIKPYVIFTIDKHLVRKRIGLLKPEKIKEVKESIKRIFSIDQSSPTAQTKQ